MEKNLKKNRYIDIATDICITESLCMPETLKINYTLKKRKRKEKWQETNISQRMYNQPINK